METPIVYTGNGPHTIGRLRMTTQGATWTLGAHAQSSIIHIIHGPPPSPRTLSCPPSFIFISTVIGNENFRICFVPLLCAQIHQLLSIRQPYGCRAAACPANVDGIHKATPAIATHPLSCTLCAIELSAVFCSPWLGEQASKPTPPV